MKISRLFVASLCAFALPAFAGSISAEVTARVSYIYDPGNVLAGQISIGQEGSGRYTYDTSVPDGNPQNPQDGNYMQTGSQESAAFTLGSLALESDTASPNYLAQVTVYDPAPNTGASDTITIYGGTLKPVAGVDGANLTFRFSDSNGSSLGSDALPTFVPNLATYRWSQVLISGWRGNDYFEVRADMLSAQLAGGAAGTLTVSPPGGTFMRGQAIVPGLLVPPDVQAVGVEGSFNYIDMPGYFSSCYRAYLISTQYIGFICPDAGYNLTSGINRVEFRVRLSDGSIIGKVVEWEVVQ